MRSLPFVGSPVAGLSTGASATVDLPQYQYAGRPSASRPTPASDSAGRSTSVFTTNASDPRMNTAGTTGYPHVRYGRGRSGMIWRSRNNATPAATLNRIDANITYVKSCSYVPDSASTADQMVSALIAMCGVRYRV